ncbi:DNA repair protein XRCC3 homolog isoform X2 [Contarinia nasturtii]|uniref:DNA repair protein XRCC3 homolog isoform X2 n=1 Tax=Contarinia nasturtii TaxID=265458 RepID=UPI0012D4B1B0|nr:DNA repair protein XRCC3 homolog isoform X2 [Contarinia nasturtii]
MNSGYIYQEQDLLDLSLNIPDRIQLILAGKNVTTVEKVLKTSNIELMSFGLTDDEVDALKTAVSSIVPSATYMTALESSSIMAPKWRHLTFGCSALDRITRNGLPIRGITEIVGESGCGKSQICLTLALNVQLSLADGGLNRSAIYICTEDAFPSKRLVQIASFYEKQYHRTNWLDNIFVEYCPESAVLMNCICNRLPSFMAQQSIGLIIIDSIAGAFRRDSDAIARADNMRKLVFKLQALADDYDCAVVCVNQITASLHDKCIPSLGLAWSNLVSNQFKIRKLQKQITKIESTILNTPVTVRSMEIGFSPELSNQFAEFIITERGICNVPNN